MATMVSATKKLLIAGGAAASLVGFGVAFAGVAAADSNETCTGAVPGASSHTTFPGDHVPGRQDKDCGDVDDTSSNSMADVATEGTWGETKIISAGSYPGNSETMTATPQKTT